MAPYFHKWKEEDSEEEDSEEEDVQIPLALSNV